MIEAFEQRGAEVWAISPGPDPNIETMRETLDLGFPLLIDEDLTVTGRYGILNPNGGTVPHPTAAVVDAQGTLRFFRVDENYRQRPAPEEILAALDDLVESPAESSVEGQEP